MKSLFQVHNETVNIWSHLVGFVICSIIVIVIASIQIIPKVNIFDGKIIHKLFGAVDGLDMENQSANLGFIES